MTIFLRLPSYATTVGFTYCRCGGVGLVSHRTRGCGYDESVDGSFVSWLRHNRDAAAIILARNRRAHALGMVTVAEGVETREQLQLLRTLGCDLLQGMHIGAPSPPGEVMACWAGAAEVGR